MAITLDRVKEICQEEGAEFNIFSAVDLAELNARDGVTASNGVVMNAETILRRWIQEENILVAAESREAEHNEM